MTIRSFELLQPRSVPEAVALLRQHGEDARPIGGGTTLVILMKQRAVHYPYLVDLQTIPGLNQITRESDGVHIAPGELGLTARQTDVLKLMVQGKPNKLICRDLTLSEGTVKVHVSAILKALKVMSRTEAVIAVGGFGWELPRIGDP
jgi:DNA-binding CsgD family transcriptional regulator